MAGIVGPLVGGWALTAVGASAVLWASLLLGAAGVPAWVMLDRRSGTRVAALRAAEAHWEPLLSGVASSDVSSVRVPVTEPERQLTTEPEPESV